MARPCGVLLASLGLCVLASCSSPTTPSEASCVGGSLLPVPGARAGQSPRQYLDTALDVIQTQDVYSPSGDWNAIRQQADAALDQSPTLNQARNEILWALTQLGNDGHADVLSPGRYQNVAGSHCTPAELVALPTGRLLEGRVGYISIPSITARTDTSAARKYMTTGLNVVAQLNAQGARSWIIDLRSNPGGDVYPMLIVAGPILGEGKISGFNALHGPTSWISYSDFSIAVDGKVVLRAPKHITLSASEPPAAVLLDAETASAAEAVAVSFIGRPTTRTFGMRTAGATGSPTRYTLSDGSVLQFSKYLDVDRTGTVYRGPIDPDQATPPLLPGDTTLDAALAWVPNVQP